jgi:hypothetical protein
MTRPSLRPLDDGDDHLCTVAVGQRRVQRSRPRAARERVGGRPVGPSTRFPRIRWWAGENLVSVARRGSHPESRKCAPRGNQA